jgi:hypothetical protein
MFHFAHPHFVDSTEGTSVALHRCVTTQAITTSIVKKLHDPVSDELACLFRRHSTNRAALMQQASPINTNSRANNTPALVVRISVVMVLSIFINQ